MPQHQWVYPARCLRIVDGDTLDLIVDVGYYLTRRDHFRLLDVDAPELRGIERPAGLAAQQFVREWIVDAGIGGWPLVIQTAKDPDNFGRYLCHLWRVSDGRNLAEDIRAAGYDSGQRWT